MCRYIARFCTRWPSPARLDPAATDRSEQASLPSDKNDIVSGWQAAIQTAHYWPRSHWPPVITARPADQGEDLPSGWVCMRVHGPWGYTGYTGVRLVDRERGPGVGCEAPNNGLFTRTFRGTCRVTKHHLQLTVLCCNFELPLMN